ncbi:hypothetical protein [Novosphingobium sp. MBES04]|uniref:hypothetical protein n=1 Tax=Novosphingobium sp. MBES04 TaxID=1206458 RepID=UPI001F57C883|nr:hypothetical protein [Novosphingobium sp. MBES04]
MPLRTATAASLSPPLGRDHVAVIGKRERQKPIARHFAFDQGLTYPGVRLPGNQKRIESALAGKIASPQPHQQREHKAAQNGQEGVGPNHPCLNTRRARHVQFPTHLQALHAIFATETFWKRPQTPVNASV